MIFNRDLTFLHQLWLYRGFYTSNKYAIREPLIYSMKTATLLVPLEMFLVHTGYNASRNCISTISKWSALPRTEAHLLHAHENARNNCRVAIVSGIIFLHMQVPGRCLKCALDKFRAINLYGIAKKNK